MRIITVNEDTKKQQVQTSDQWKDYADQQLRALGHSGGQPQSRSVYLGKTEKGNDIFAVDD